MKKALLIVGPTAVGKTNLAFKISKQIPSYLISADSIQVYRGADIISGKDNSIFTALIDVVDPDQQFSVKDFVQQIRPIVGKSIDENKIPIVVGGTGFYIDALFGKIDTISIPPNKKLREKLTKLPLEQLQEKLIEINPDRFYNMNNSDRQNPRRLVRAIEVGSKKNKIEPIFEVSEVLIVGLRTSTDDLRVRIKTRVDQRIKMGALPEAKELFKKYEKLSPQIRAANGYKEIFDYLLGKTNWEQVVDYWVKADSLHAKNQMTWFQKRPNIHWFDIEKNGYEQEIMKLASHNFIL